MWHEARKQEKLIKGMIVDYRRRAERRRDFYEKIKADPTQFLQLHGRPCKIHLDPAVAAAGESSGIMMPWQGDPDNMIDRFDVRAHLDFIPEVVCPEIPSEDLGYEERNCNYERYRILAQNMFLGISEEKFLHQLSIEEKYGVTLEEREAQRDKQSEKKNTGAAIGFNYDSDIQPTPTLAEASNEDNKDDSDEESDAEIIDVDLSIDVNKIEMTQAHAMNACGANFGMPGTDLFSFLTGDADEAEKSKQLMREEKEKALFSGRKSRRERRAHRDKKLALRVVSPPHYAARPPSPRALSPSPTRSPSPSTQIHPDKITFITSFGGEEEQHHVSPERPVLNKAKTYASVLKDGRKRLRTPSPRRSKSSPVKRPRGRYPSSRRSSSRSRSRSRRSASSSRSRSNLRSKSRSRSKLRSRSRSKSTSSGSNSRSRSRRRSRSSSRSSRSRRRPRSRSSSRRRSSSKSSSSRDNRRRQNSSSKFFSSNNNNNASSSGQNDRSGGGTTHIPKYYGRKRDGVRSSSSELSIDSESDNDSETRDNSRDKMTGGKSSHVSNVIHSSGAPSKQVKEKITAKERLKRKMQAQLSRQLRADMKAEAERQEREQLLQQERDDEMRELAIKIRRRQRELRHQRYSQSSNDGSSSPHQNKASPRLHSRDQSSDEEDESPPGQNEKNQERRSHEKQQPSRQPTKPKVWEHEAVGEGHSSRYHGAPGTSEWRGDSRGGRNVSDFRGNYRDGNYDNRPHYNSYQSRPYNKYSYRREDDGRGGFGERNRDQDYGKSGRHWQGRKEYEDGGHRGYTERSGKYNDGDSGATKYRREHDTRKDDNVIKYPNKKLVDY